MLQVNDRHSFMCTVVRLVPTWHAMTMEKEFIPLPPAQEKPLSGIGCWTLWCMVMVQQGLTILSTYTFTDFIYFSWNTPVDYCDIDQLWNQSVYEPMCCEEGNCELWGLKSRINTWTMREAVVEGSSCTAHELFCVSCPLNYGWGWACDLGIGSQMPKPLIQAAVMRVHNVTCIAYMHSVATVCCINLSMGLRSNNWASSASVCTVFSTADLETLYEPAQSL